MTAQRLSEILKRPLAADPVIAGVTADSRKVSPGALFAALPGATADGRAFIPQAVAAGAAAILTEQDMPDQAIPVVRVHDVRRAYALAARAFWGAEPEVVVAVTGTNGKTSVATFCRQIFAAVGRKSASLGTLGLQLQDQNLTPPGLTTPDAADVARMAADLADRGVTHLALEASSHGLDQRRLDGLTLKAAAFLNLTQDHLDYHKQHGRLSRRQAAPVPHPAAHRRDGGAERRLTRLRRLRRGRGDARPDGACPWARAAWACAW